MTFLTRSAATVFVLAAAAPLVPASPASAATFRDGRGDALLVREVNRGAGVCPDPRRRSAIEIRTKRAGRPAGPARRLGSPCDARYPVVGVGRGGAAVVAWREAGRIRVADGTTRRGVRDRGAISERSSHLSARSVAVGSRGEALVAYVQREGLHVASRSRPGRWSGSQRVGSGKGSVVAALADDGAAAVAYTTTGAGGEVGTSQPNKLRVARRLPGAARFEPAVQLASGTLRDVVAVAGPGGVLVGWTAEEVGDGGVSAVAYAPTGAPFEAPHPFERPFFVQVDPDGTARARNQRGEIRRTGPGTWE